MTSQQDWFHSYKPISEEYVYMGDDHGLKIAGVGTINLRMHDGTIRTIEDVRHVKGLIKKNYCQLDNLMSLDSRLK